MSQEEVNQNFNWERKKHEFFLSLYAEKNWIVHKDNITAELKSDWDVKLEVFASKYKLADEKARQGDHNDCLIEIVQDMKTGKMGWLFGEKDWIFYGSWIDLESFYPSSLYLIEAEKLKEYINSLEGFIKTCISKKGWGNTWNLVLNWQDLIEKRIVEKLL